SGVQSYAGMHPDATGSTIALAPRNSRAVFGPMGRQHARETGEVERPRASQPTAGSRELAACLVRRRGSGASAADAGAVSTAEALEPHHPAVLRRRRATLQHHPQRATRVDDARTAARGGEP